MPGPEQHFGQTRSKPRVARRDPFSIAALVMGCLACCPMASLMGILLGALSLARIRTSDGALTGRRLAWAGIIASAVIGIGSSALLERIADRAQSEISAQTVMATTQLFGTGADPGAWWPSSLAPGARTFGRETRTALGALKSVTTRHGATAWTDEGAQETLQLYMEFDRGTIIGAATVVVSADPRTWLPTISLRSVELGESESIGFAGASYPPTPSAPEPPSPEPSAPKAGG